MLEVEEGDRPASKSPADDPRGLSNNGFQSLVRRWRADRRLRTLLPYAGRARRRRGDTAEHRLVEGELDKLLSGNPFGSLVTSAREASRRTGAAIAANTALLVARERRALLRADPTWLAKHYGMRLLVDVCSMDAMVATGNGQVAPASLAMLVEGASGIILGHAVGLADDAIEMRRRSTFAAGLDAVVAGRLDVAGRHAWR
ncbi:hypothetical protein AB5I41_24930 [Sphingomonas sp. MMS24-JH45]